MKPKHRDLEKDEEGYTLMNETNLKIICERDDLYTYPELNEKLYLHYKGSLFADLGFYRIAGLKPYTNLCALWLNNNGILKIEGLGHLSNLTMLFLNHNLIDKIENLDGCINLNTLNLSHNKIKVIEGLEKNTRLTTINLSYNQVQTPKDCQLLPTFTSLSAIDLSNNLIEYDEALLDIFVKMPSVACISLKNNPFVRSYPNYRRRFSGFIPTLKYLDDKPVNDGERRMSEAWVREGIEGERSERSKLALEKRVEQIKTFEDIEQRISDDKPAVQAFNPYQSFSITRDNEGKIIILNRTEEEIKYIKEHIYNEEIAEFSKSEEEKNREYLQRQRNQQILKQIQLEEKEQEEEGIEDLNKKYKSFLIQKQKKEEVKKATPKTEDSSKSTGPLLNDFDLKIKEWQELRKNWPDQFDEILETLLLNNKFDFQQVSLQFEYMIGRDHNLEHIPTSPNELRKIWTYVELTKYRGRDITLFKSKMAAAEEQKQETLAQIDSEPLESVSEIDQKAQCKIINYEDLD